MSQPKLVRRAMSVGVVGAATLATTFSAVPAHAVEPIVSDALGVPAVTTFVVDGGHSHLLFGSGDAQNGVLVTDLSGAGVTTVPTSGGVDDISLSPDGLYAYAASAAVNTIYRITLATLAVTPFTTPASDCPVSVAAVDANHVAFGYTCDAQWGGVAVLDTSDGTVKAATGNQIYDPWVRWVPGSTQVLGVSRANSETVAMEYQTSSGTPVLSHDTSSFIYGLPNCGYLNDMAISPDGASMLTSCGGNTMLREYRVADFTASATYPTGTMSQAVAYSPTGGYVGAGMNGDYDDDLAVFKSDTSLLYSLDYGEDDDGNAGPYTAPHGVAFSADGSQFYTLASHDPDDPYSVYLVTLPATSVPTFPPPVSPPSPPPPTGTTPPPPRPLVSTITGVSPARQLVGHRFALTGTLAFAGSPAPGVTVAVSQTVNGVTTPLGTTTTTATGSFSYAVTPKAVGSVTYSVGFLGDLGHYGSTAATQTIVARAPAGLTLKVAKVKGKVYAVTAHLTSWGVNRRVVISANDRTIGKGVVNSKGLLTVRFTRKKPTTFTVVFTGDVNDYPARATKALH